MWHAIWGAISEYWDLAALALTWLGIGVLHLRRRWDWSRRRFSRQVNFSLNTLEEEPDGSVRLLIRTLIEVSAHDVWINDHGVSLVREAAVHTSVDDPIVHLHEEVDRELVQLALLNVLSERFSDAFLARSLGRPVHTDRYLFALTYERFGPVHTEKLRVMVVQESTLIRLFGSEALASRVSLARQDHDDRLTTLRRIWENHRSPAVVPDVGEVELGVSLGLTPNGPASRS